jgi:hypothetical protein
MDSLATLHSSLQDWTDIDVIQLQIARFIGIVSPQEPFQNAKALYWSKNATGDALASFIVGLVEAGVFERSAHDATRLRWNPKYLGFIATPGAVAR